jgi:pyridoxamine 5'-phosphate oxidase
MSGPFDQTDAAAAGEFLPEPLPADPFGLLKAWWDEAHSKRVQPNPNAMTLATVDPDGRIGARTVLCKAINITDGFFVFYTNYSGRKGVALDAGSRAALVFHWDDLDRQVRVEGLVVRSPDEESDAYFASRPWQSRIGAWASDQSRPVASRAAMQDKLAAAMRRFGLDPDRPPETGANVNIPRPRHWGGYRIWAERLELWAAGPGRLHERAEWKRTLAQANAGFQGGPWSSTRLQP